MPTAAIAQPDVTLMIDTEGVIRKITVSDALASQGAQSLIGRRWAETVGAVSHDDVRLMIENAIKKGVNGLRQVVQQFSDGVELPIEYTAISLGANSGLIAVGKSLRAVSELQSQLVAAQRAIEQDYWKLREIESRYRLLFDQSNEPVILVRGRNLRISEANVAAVRLLGFGATPPESMIGREFLPEIAARDHKALQNIIDQASATGHAPAVLVHLVRQGTAILVRISQIAADSGQAFMIRLAPGQAIAPEGLPPQADLVRDMIERAADGFVIVDAKGEVQFGNDAFMDLAGANMAAEIVGKPLAHWFAKPGADASVLMATLRGHKVAKLFATTMSSDLDIATDVEISATADDSGTPKYFGLVIRDVSRRMAVREAPPAGKDEAIEDLIGKAPLQEIVKVFVDGVERQCIVAALARAGGNRTASAKMLGMSRQSLHTKISRLKLD
jgi:transcriptional regulator PpsR